jgi:hypothetical protein
VSENKATVFGVSVEEWQSAYRLGIQEFAAHRFVIKREGDLIRVGFGNPGPPLDEKGQHGCAVYTHAVTMSPTLALELSRTLRDIIAGPAPNSSA